MKLQHLLSFKLILVGLLNVILFFGITLRADADEATNNRQEFTKEGFTQAMAEMGITFSQLNQNLNILIDQQKVLAEIPMMQSMGAINPDISQTAINLIPIFLSSSIGIFFTTAILPYLYENTNADLLHVSGYIMSSDDYGNPIKHLCYSFDFDRKLYKRINWNNFAAGSLIKVTPHYKLSSWCDEKIRAELNQ